MATITVRGLPDEVRDALKRRAARKGHSMEAEAREILADTIRADIQVPNALVALHLATRENPVDLELPERNVEPPREVF
ncbi:hypothetical protein GA0111570_104171 [Raineyella antarctica]|uniref:Antitoxin FitA-like ribbon-helix-helix domain-containing protein n=1 Tax=Raineyella antarctica TaxID=1577474 RepID=A0A1G6GP53_9ACTN|nr:hypothetical protein [Raineyella antarctica]SDB83643.1 hypothetical protein GA0111570_104171 [Raineyella antarctica]